MNIYLVTREDADYDQYRGFVVAAKSKVALRAVIDGETSKSTSRTGAWDKVTIQRVGSAARGVGPGILLSDFRAG